jgi:hypothetical protein
MAKNLIFAVGWVVWVWLGGEEWFVCEVCEFAVNKSKK